jgi:hypothetical protein
MHTLSYFCKQVLPIGYVWVRYQMWKNEEKKEKSCRLKKDNIMVSKAITYIMWKKKNISENWTWAAHIIGEHVTNWGTAGNMMECPLLQLINSQCRNWKIKLYIAEELLSVVI